MTSGRDEALSWGGDDDPTLDVGATTPEPVAEPAEPEPVAAEPATLPDGYAAVGKGSEVVAPEAAPDPDTAPPRMSNATLIGIGVFAGIYVILSIGWLLGASRLQLVAQLFLEPIAFQVTIWLAVLALPLWFVTVLWLTRRTWVRFALLAAGAVLLIPWPFVLAGAAL